MESIGILVGVDGSRGSNAAVTWAAAEAQIRGCDLTVVHACDPRSYGLWTAPKVVRDGIRRMNQPLVDAAVSLVRESQPSVRVKGKVMVAGPARALTRLSARASLTVIGRTGYGAVSRFVLGSIATHVLVNAASPVIAVDWRPVRRPGVHVTSVVAAIADPAAHANTLHFAFTEAARHHCRLRVLRTVTDPSKIDEARCGVADALAWWRSTHPVVDEVDDVRLGRVVPTLGSLCSADDLIVLGHHRRTPLTPNTLGRTASAVLRTTESSVAIVHEPQDTGKVSAGALAPADATAIPTDQY